MRSNSEHRGGLRFLAVVFALTLSCRLDGACAQSAAPAAAPKAQAAPAQTAAASATAPQSADRYFIEFRARYAQTYGHAFVVFGRGTGPGKKISPSQIAGLHPATDSPIPFWVGHIIPVQSETGASEGDTEEKYVSARYRVTLNKAEYERTVAFIRKLQKSSPMWQEMVYNCNDFVADIARFMGLKAPSSMVMPQDFITRLRELNGGPRHAAAAVPAPSPQ